MAVLRILVVDDNDAVRRGLSSKHQEQPEWLVVGQASDGAEAVIKVSELRPDVVILDIDLPRMNGLEAARTIRQLAPSIEILFLSFHDSRTVVQEALNAGGRGYLCKSDAGRDLVSAVEAVSQHQAFLSASIQGGETISAAMVSPVTEQESLPGPPSQANQTLTAGTVAPATEKESGIDTEKEPKKNPGALKAA